MKINEASFVILLKGCVLYQVIKVKSFTKDFGISPSVVANLGDFYRQIHLLPVTFWVSVSFQGFLPSGQNDRLKDD